MIATKVEFAFGADLTADPATWTWTDVSVYARGQVDLQFGRSDEASTTQPATCSLRLANNDSRFSPHHPSGAYYPNVRRNTPVRVSLNPGSGLTQRFQGYVDTFTPVWLFGNSTQAEVRVTASGILRRLGQGTAPVYSPLRRATTADGAVEYWPLEDVNGSTQGASALGHTPMNVAVSPVTFGVDSVSVAGSLTLPDLSGGGELSCPYFATVNNSSHSIGFLVRVTAANSTPVRWQIGFGSYDRARVDISSSVGISVNAFAGASSATLVSSGTIVTDGAYHYLRVVLAQSGSNIAAQLWVDGTQVATNTVTSVTLGAPNSMRVNPQGPNFGGGNVNSVGHLAVFNGAGSNAPYNAVNGYTGESATARLSRLCTEQNIPITITGTSDVAMGAQPVKAFLDLLRECETADQGILYDGVGPGLAYLARPARYNLPVSLALDCNRSQVKLPFAPIEDDQRVRNDWTVFRPGGSFGRAIDLIHAAANGPYNDSIIANVQLDSVLTNHAAWRLHLGTIDEMRVPTLTFDPLHSPELQSQWFATTLGERITATNLPTQFPPGILDQIVEGYAETWNQVSWTVAPNLSPYQPWNVDALGSAFRLELAGQTLGANLNPGATTLTLNTATGYDLFTTTARFPADFPLDLKIAGWQIHVTAASGSSSPQTLTIDPSPNTSVIPSGTAVALWRPACLAL